MSDILPKRLLAGHEKPTIRVSPLVLDAAALEVSAVYARLATGAEGLGAAQVAARLAGHGPKVLARGRRGAFPRLLWSAVLNPLVILLAILAIVSFSTGDPRAGSMMVLMVVLSVGLKLY